MSVIINWSSSDNNTDSARERKRAAPKQGEELIAEKNGSLKTVSDFQQFEKDVLLPADHYLGKGLLSTETTEDNSKVELPGPEGSGTDLQRGDEVTVSLVALVGQCLTAVAQASSSAWMTMLKLSIQNMNMQQDLGANIAPKAIIQQYQAEAAATRDQANQASAEGIGQIVTFASTALVSGLMEGFGPSEKGKVWENKPSTKIIDTAKDEAAKAATTATENAATLGAGDAEKVAIKNGLNEGDAAAKKLLAGTDANSQKDTWWSIAKAKGKQVFLFSHEWLQRSTGMAMTANQIQDGITKTTVTSYWENLQAGEKEKQGIQQAIQQMSQTNSQAAGQRVSQSEDMRNSLQQQGVDLANNIWKAISDTGKDASSALFQRI